MNKTILLIPTLIALIFSVILFFKKDKNQTHFKVLAAYFLLYVILFISVTIVGVTKLESQKSLFVDIMTLAFFSVILFIPVVFYHYVVTLSDFKSKAVTIKKHYYLPVLLTIINFISFILFMLLNDETSFVYKLVTNIITGLNFTATLFVFPILSIFYVLRTLGIYRAHKREILKVFSYNKGVDLKWILNYIIGYALFIIGLYVVLSFINPYIIVFTHILLSGYFIYVGINGYKQSNVLYNEGRVGVIEKVMIEENTKLVKPLYTNELKKIIEVEMTTNELFLDHELTIHKLARVTNSNSKYVSNLINKEYEQNFVQFVNSYRIEKAKELLLNEDYMNYTIEAISKASGFNSKSAFNNAFKLNTDFTPTQYRANNIAS